MFTFINKFVVTGDPTEFESVLRKINDYMCGQPGYRSHSLYRSTQNSLVYVEMADWDSANAHRAATGGETFRGSIQALMKLATADPGGFERLSE